MTFQVTQGHILTTPGHLKKSKSYLSEGVRHAFEVLWDHLEVKSGEQSTNNFPE